MRRRCLCNLTHGFFSSSSFENFIARDVRTKKKQRKTDKNTPKTFYVFYYTGKIFLVFICFFMFLPVFSSSARFVRFHTKTSRASGCWGNDDARLCVVMSDFFLQLVLDDLTTVGRKLNVYSAIWYEVALSFFLACEEFLALHALLCRNIKYFECVSRNLDP